MIGATAVSFTAILFLHATSFQMGVLMAMRLVPAFLASLFTGAWVDRSRRRPLLIGADIGRALALTTIPLAAWFGILHIEQVYIVALLVSTLTILFDISYRSYLPTLISREALVDGNSKLSASAAIAEFGGFSLAGWLVQLFTAPFAILIDAGSFIVSAISIGLIRAQEPVIDPQEKSSLRFDILTGFQAVKQQSLLSTLAIILSILGLSSGIYGSLIVLYMNRGLGFNPGILGMIWAIGGISSFLGAALAPGITYRLGIGLAMGIGLVVSGFTQLIIVMAEGATLVSAAILICQQLGDGFYILYEINQVSLQQTITSKRILGRVNATLQFLLLGSTLAGSLLGGFLGEKLGLRLTLAFGACGTLIAALILSLSPVGRLKRMPEAGDDLKPR